MLAGWDVHPILHVVLKWHFSFHNRVAFKAESTPNISHCGPGWSSVVGSWWDANDELPRFIAAVLNWLRSWLGFSRVSVAWHQLPLSQPELIAAGVHSSEWQGAFFWYAYVCKIFQALDWDLREFNSSFLTEGLVFKHYSPSCSPLSCVFFNVGRSKGKHTRPPYLCWQAA